MEPGRRVQASVWNQRPVYTERRPSLIYRGRLDDFSVERLMRFLTALHRDIRIVVGDKPRRGRGRVIVEAA